MNLLLWAIMFLSFLVFSYEEGIYPIPLSISVTDYSLTDLDNGLKGHWTGLFANLSSSDYNYGLYFLENGDARYRLSIVVYDNTIDDGYFGQEMWTANSSRAISDKGFLSIGTDGNLVLYDDGTEAWSTQTKGYGVQWLSISDRGNLVLWNNSGDPNSGNKIWQSFDNPTNTMVCTQVLRQGMKLFNGDYSLQMRESMLVALYGDQIYKKWNYTASSGNYLAFCCNDTRLSLQLRSDLDYVTQYNLLDSEYCQVGADSITEIMGLEISNSFSYATFVRLNSMGQLTATKWAPSKGGFEDCDLPTVCGSYGLCTNGSCSCTYSSDFTYADQSNHAAGCKEQEPQVLYTSSCSNSSLTKPIAGIDYFANQYINPEINVTSLQDCKDACLRNKSCQTGFFITDSCFLYSQVSSLKETNNSSHYVFFRMCHNISTTPSAHSNSSKLKVVISISVVLGFFLALAALIACWLKKKMQNSDSEEEDSILESYISEATLKRFSYKELEEITGEFKDELGKGGFGTVYKGRLPNGNFVAVKKLDGLTQNPKEFYAEVSILSKVHHFNLVQLVGFCAERRKRALVYEYMMNGSLDQWIFGKKSADLNWQTRLNIAMGAAKGMAYLHEECSERIMHLDVKPQNILLDHNFEAKVSDFGLSRFIDRGQSFVMTMVRGTRGYLAPEWFTQGAINVKADVFSFGVVLLEIIGWNTQNILQESGTMFRLISETNFLRSLLVKNFGDSFDLEEAKRMVKVACLCVQHEVDDRPKMSMVVQMLEGKAPIPEIKTNHGFHRNISAQTRENFMKLLESKSSFAAGSSTVDLESTIDPR